MTTPPQRSPAARRTFAFERGLVRVRWFGIALGIYQVLDYAPNPGTAVPSSMAIWSGIGLGLLTALNVAVWLILRRDPDERLLARLGLAVFLCDFVALHVITFAFAFERYGNTWVILTIASLEGAQRYQMRGALFPVVAGLPIETVREIFTHAVYGFPFFVQSITFRVGFSAIIATVAGLMSRNLERERALAEDRAAEREEVAARESAARRESNAFQAVILAGVSAVELREALGLMIEAIATQLGYGHVVLLLRDEDGGLTPFSSHGVSVNARLRRLEPGEGISGAVARSGVAELVHDVLADPRYYAAEAGTRSQMSVPVMSNDSVIGVIAVESEHAGAFTHEDLSRIQRLAAQMALVIEHGRLLARERATVERLRELDTMKSDFIAIASHELRTPLTAMKGTIRTLLRPDVNVTEKQLNDFLAVLDRQSDRLNRLVEDLMIVSRLDVGGVHLQMGEVDLHQVLAEVLAEIGATAFRVSLALPPSLPHLVTDGQRVGQIARNLIENALKFSPADTTVRVSAHPDGEGFVLSVADDGPGIATGEVEHIFDRFHQVGGPLRRLQEGLGLGLYITKRIAEALGASIEVDTALGRGSTFHVRIPAGLDQAGKSEIA